MIKSKKTARKGVKPAKRGAFDIKKWEAGLKTFVVKTRVEDDQKAIQLRLRAHGMEIAQEAALNLMEERQVPNEGLEITEIPPGVHVTRLSDGGNLGAFHPDIEGQAVPIIGTAALVLGGCEDCGGDAVRMIYNLCEGPPVGRFGRQPGPPLSPLTAGQRLGDQCRASVEGRVPKPSANGYTLLRG